MSVLMRFTMRSSLVLFLLLVLTSNARAQADWQSLGVLPGPPNRGSAAFFFNANDGLIGTGDFFKGGPARIYYTTNGGQSWQTSIMPNLNILGQVTDIWFKDRQNGWATITEAAYTGWSGLYKSTDAGRNWKLVRQSQSPVSVRENSRGVYFTDRGTGGTGIIFSGDGGKTFSVAAVNSAPLGIDFLNDVNGYVTSETGGSAPHMRTTDRGQTWTPITSVKEAWGVFADPATNSFYYASEKDGAQTPNFSGIDRVRASGVLESEWNGSANGITGGISGYRGCTSTMYAQGQGGVGRVPGFLRSTDGGQTWDPVGGPSNGHDTRFAVTGRGAVVYAFDNSGNIYKTMTGGDGTLRATVAQNLTLKTVLLPKVEARECDSIVIPIELVLANCDSARVLAVEILDDPFSELVPLTQVGRFVGGAKRDTLRIRYRPQQIIAQTFRVRITLEQLDGFTEDTILNIPAVGLPSAEIFTVTEQTSPRTIDFGKLNICTGDSIRIITLTNLGCGNLNVSNITLSQSAFELRSRINPISLSPGDDRKYLVRFRPKTLGAQTAWLVFHTRDGRDSIRLTGEGIPGQRGLALSQPQISSSTCDSIDVKLTIRNTSCGEVDLTGLSTGTPLSIVSFVPKLLPSDSTIEVTVRFVPKTQGTQGYVLNIDASIGGSNFDTTLSIQATATAGALVLDVADVLEFDSVSTCSQVTLPVILHNAGCLTINVTGSVLDGVATDFTISQQLQDPTLLRNEYDTIWITFKPGSIGEFTMTLRIMSNAGEQTVRLHGFGRDDQGEVVLSMAGTLVTDLCTAQDFNIRINNGTCDQVMMDSFVVTGDVNDFVFPDRTTQGIKVGDAYPLFGQFTPTTGGLRRITVRVFYTDLNGSHFRDIEITGVGSSAPPIVASLPSDSTMQAQILSDLTMPIYVRGVGAGAVRTIEFALRLNTDLLTPMSMDLNGTEMAGAQQTMFNVENDSVTVRLEFATPRTLGDGILGRVNCRSFLTDTLQTQIELIRFTAGNGTSLCLATSIQSIGQPPVFTLDPECGDQYISDHMADRIVSISSIRPNPSTGKITLALDMPAGSSDASISVYDGAGRVVLMQPIPEHTLSTQEVTLDIPGGTGQYFVRVASAAGSSTRSVIVTE